METIKKYDGEIKDLAISIVVLTYNLNYNKLFQTLTSIINQKKIEFEIIIADDGTKNFNSNLIMTWMKEHKFDKYKIIHNEINFGTVKNTYNALTHANGKYVKLISPGDFLYDENTLNDVLLYMKKNNFDIVFGKAIYYNIDKNGKTYFINKSNPINIKPYLENDIKQIKKMFLLYQDTILGASFVCNRSLLLIYVQKLVGYAKYAEDCAIALMIADEISINFWNNYLIWYEYSTGISTKGDSIWLERIKQDYKECFKIILNKHPKYKNIYELHYGKKSINDIIFKVKRKILVKYLLFKNFFNKQKLKSVKKEKLEAILKCNLRKGD